MDTFLTIAIDLIKTTCVIVTFAYVLTRTTFFTDVLDKKFNIKNQVVLIVLFGILSIFGTYGGLKLPSGAIANIRDLGPLAAGLVAGPIVGFGAGLIGGVHRYLLGGFVGLPCSLATVLAGLLGGMIYKLNKGKCVTVWQAVLLVFLMESLHVGLVLWLARPYDIALSVSQELILPMMGANALGMTIFIFRVRNLISERETAAEKEKLQRERMRLEYEMEMARNIQQSFLPNSPPQIEGFDLAALYLSAEQVGGDFYDFIPVSEDKWGIVIADVSGKGVPAALFMALSRTLIRVNVSERGTAAEAMQKANRLISQETQMGMFVTLFYALLDFRKRQLRYINAGHNPPFVIKQGSKEAVMLQAKGIAMGIMDDIILEEEEIKLDRNDILVLYTDGITEAMNTAGEQFGEQRLASLIQQSADISLKDLAVKVKEDVFAFAQGQPQHDDFTLVLLKAT